MPDEPTTAEEEKPPHFIPRRTELEELANALPLKGVEIGDNRIFNIWGEDGVGKSSFISEFRESQQMAKEKVLWLQPTRDEPLDDIPEFIRACAKAISYPANPSKEKKISEQLESVQRGKVNPIVSDDSILITRSSIAKQKKAYINQAAASSVGRTENVRDDFDINVGLGESKANNHAEGFLDALPLKALGTDLTIIYIEHYDRLSVTIIDWLRDYVFPAATKGAYRRSLVFLIESQDPLRFAYPNESWGEWSNVTQDIRLHPLSNEDALHIAISLGADEQSGTYLVYRSLGYPGDLYNSSKLVSTLNRGPARQFLDTLDTKEQRKIAALSLPQTIQAEDLAAIFGAKATATFAWFKSLTTKLATPSANGKTISLSEALRCEAICRFVGDPKFETYAKAWQPMGRFTRNIPSRNDRSKLLLLAGLHWIDTELCTALFKDQASKILPFITESSTVFNHQRNRYSLSERYRSDLQKAAHSLAHPGMGVVFKKANKLWEERTLTLNNQIADIEAKVTESRAQLAELTKKQTENIAQIRIQERAIGESDNGPKNKNLFSKIMHLGESEELDPNSPEGLRKLNQNLSVEIHEKESEIDELENELQKAQDSLKHPYIPLSTQ